VPDNEPTVSPSEDPDPDPSAEEQEAFEADEEAQAVADLDLQDARLLKLLPTLLEQMSWLNGETEVERLRFAANCALIAICERIGRLCRRDLPADQA
jgi:hypothetical protein